jgi:hypothetical protein
MRRLFCAVLIAVMALASPACVLAAGAPIRKPPVVIPEAPGPSASSAPSVPSVPPERQGIGRVPIFGGCGGRRVRDPRTGQCRGPADIGR